MSQSVVKTISDQICDRLRSELLYGVHPAGQKLREQELARRFQVSRHPVRKALQKLTLEGLLNTKPNCGAVVATSQIEHVEALLTPMRIQLELYALRRAFSFLTDEHRIHWQNILRGMKQAAEAQNAQDVLDQDAAFHQYLLVAAELDDMIPVWQGIFGRMKDYHCASNTRHADLRVIPYIHDCLFECLCGGNFERVYTAWGSHLENGDFNLKARKAWQRQQRKLRSQS